MTGKLAVVFGGSGFVGRHVVRELAQRGWRVRVAVRRPHLAGFLRPMGYVGQVQLEQVNVRYQPSIAKALEGADAVVNLVGILSQSGAQNFDAVQAGGSASIARLAREAGIANFVQVSSIGADMDAASDYARTKAVAEKAVRDAIPEAIILRPSIIFGVQDKFFNKFAAMAAFSPALPLIGGGKTKFQPVYVDDVADTICEALVRPETHGGIYELGGPRVYTFRELMKLMLAETGRKRILAPIPFALAPILGFIGEMIGIVPIFDKPITRDQIKMLKSDNTVNDDGSVGVIGDFGISPTAVEAILPGYMVRFRKYGQFAEVAS